MTPPVPKLVRGLWRTLVARYPASFRDACGLEMEVTFAQRYQAARARGVWAALSLVRRELLALGRGAIAERVAARRAGPGRRTPLFAAQDLRHALRRLARAPVFTLMTVLVLAGGLAISIFTYSFLRTAVTAPIPVDRGDRVVRLSGETRDGAYAPIDAAEFARMRPGLASLKEVGAFVDRNLTVGAREGAWTLDATATEWNLFTLTGARPLLGRGLTPADQEPGAPPVVVLSHRVWRVGFGLDSAVVGRVIDLNRVPTRVVGVMAEGFEFPVAAGAWVPIDPRLLDPDQAGAGSVSAYARLADGASPAQAEAELAVRLARARIEPTPPGEVDRRPARIAVRSFPVAQLGDEGLWFVAILHALASLILLLACINVGNLLLARANERRRELAVRQALGAPRSRLVMQHLWETILLCLAGGALATLLATAGLDVLDAWARAHLEGNLAFWWRWGFDRSLLLAAGGFVTAAIVVLGAAVSLRATSERVLDTLRAGSSPTEAREDTRWSSVLVVTQIVVVSVVMFVGVTFGLMGNRALHLDFGYDTRRLIQTGIDLPPDRYPSWARVDRFRHALAAALEARPEIEGVQIQANLADIRGPEGEVELAGRTGGPAARAYVVAAEGPLATLGIPVVTGRFFAAGDARDGAPVVVVSQALAHVLWPDGGAEGRRIRLRGLEGEAAPWRTVVGVASDVPYGNPISRDRSPLAAYLPLAQTSVRGGLVFVKYRGDPARARAAIVEVAGSADPWLAFSRPQAVEEALGKGTAMITATAKMFGGCFLFALLLAVTGTYGLVARGISRRTREIGIRRALGASDGRILKLLVWQGGRHLGLGALIALPFTALGALGLARALPIERPLALGVAVGVSVAIAAIVFAATWLPTRRAVRIEPRDALWQE